MEITAFDASYIEEAARLFADNFALQRQATPALPERFTDPACTAELLERMVRSRPGLMATEGGRLAGYLGWYIVPGFRNTERKAAYCPVWAHATVADSRSQIYRALYRAAAQQWAEAGCDMHALTVLAAEQETVNTWFWSGFGLAVVDAIRALEPIRSRQPEGIVIRKAGREDAGRLAEIEAEHCQHYREAPISMIPDEPSSAAEFEAFLHEDANSAWLALDGEKAAGYMRFEGSGEGASEVVAAETTAANTGAYVRPDYRGRSISPALLNAAMQDYRSRGYQRCSVDFESFNPEAVVFWTRYFEPVCYSLFRVPEAIR